MENRVLTWAELCELPDGATAYIEERDPEYTTGVATVIDGALMLETHAYYWLSVAFPSSYYIGLVSPISARLAWRAWLREPTPEELAANPWP